jgi:hypothetical protein
VALHESATKPLHEPFATHDLISPPGVALPAAPSTAKQHSSTSVMHALLPHVNVELPGGGVVSGGSALVLVLVEVGVVDAGEATGGGSVLAIVEAVCVPASFVPLHAIAPKAPESSAARASETAGTFFMRRRFRYRRPESRARLHRVSGASPPGLPSGFVASR